MGVGIGHKWQGQRGKVSWRTLEIPNVDDKPFAALMPQARHPNIMTRLRCPWAPKHFERTFFLSVKEKKGGEGRGQKSVS